MQWTSLCLLSEFLWHVYIFRYMYNSFIDHYIYQVLLCLLSDKVSLHGMFVFLNIYVQSFYRSFNRLSPIIFTDWLGEFAWYVCIFRYMYNRVCGLLFPSLTCCFMYSGEQSGFFLLFYEYVSNNFNIFTNILNNESDKFMCCLLLHFSNEFIFFIKQKWEINGLRKTTRQGYKL